MFSAAVSLPDDSAAAFSEMPKYALVDRLREMTEFMLSRANLLRTTKIDTMQAFIIYLVSIVSVSKEEKLMFAAPLVSN